METANEIEVEELLLTQISRASRATTLETTKSISTISTKIISLIGLCNDTNNIESLVDYDSDSVIIDDDDMVGRMNQPSFNDLGSDSVEYVGVINSSIGDAVFQALDTLISPLLLPTRENTGTPPPPGTNRN